MSNCCTHTGGCDCILVGGAGVTVTGAGTIYSPYTISFDSEYIQSLGTGVSEDTDDVPYFQPTNPDFVVFYDTDGVPYYDTGVGGIGILQDTDTIPYLAA